MKRRELGATHPDLAITINNLGILHESEGRKRDAELPFNLALKLFETSLGKSHPSKAATLRSFSKRAATPDTRTR
jgi:hypothetical protein